MTVNKLFLIGLTIGFGFLAGFGWDIGSYCIGLGGAAGFVLCAVECGTMD